MDLLASRLRIGTHRRDGIVAECHAEWDTIIMRNLENKEEGDRKHPTTRNTVLGALVKTVCERHGVHVDTGMISDYLSNITNTRCSATQIDTQLQWFVSGTTSGGLHVARAHLLSVYRAVRGYFKATPTFKAVPWMESAAEAVVRYGTALGAQDTRRIQAIVGHDKAVESTAALLVNLVCDGLKADPVWHGELVRRQRGFSAWFRVSVDGFFELAEADRSNRKATLKTLGLDLTRDHDASVVMGVPKVRVMQLDEVAQELLQVVLIRPFTARYRTSRYRSTITLHPVPLQLPKPRVSASPLVVPKIKVFPVKLPVGGLQICNGRPMKRRKVEE